MLPGESRLAEPIESYRDMFMIQAVLFDLGDTLLHFETGDRKKLLHAVVRPVYDGVCEMGYQPPAYEAYSRIAKWQFLRAFLWSRIRRREVRLMHEIRRVHSTMRLNLTEEETIEVTRRCLPAVREFFTKDASAVEVISELDGAGYKLGIVSNTVMPGATIDDFLEREGLLSYFPVRVYSSEVGFMKPNRRIFQLAVDRLDIAPEKTFFVGDRLDNDVRGAARLGMKTILIQHGPGKRRGWKRPDYIVYSLPEIPIIVRNQRA